MALRIFPVVLFTSLLAGAPGTAQEPSGGAEPGDPGKPCGAPEHHQFDFWIGEWEVRSPSGQLLGRNSIRRIAGSCGLLEDWHGEGGSAGMSINTWDGDRGAWTQRWVGAGATLWLEGRFDGEQMTLSGTRGTERGEVLDRITWTPLAGGGLRQHWEVSADGGETWKDLFIGIYSRAPAATASTNPAGAGHKECGAG